MDMTIETDNAKITDVYLGTGDKSHGFYSVGLTFDYHRAGQGCFISPDRIPDILSILRIDDFMDLKGMLVRVKHDHNHISGLGHILEERWLSLEEGSESIYSYDPNFGDDKVCVCSVSDEHHPNDHRYYRHFDTYDDMRPVGCKYCPCAEFREVGQ